MLETFEERIQMLHNYQKMKKEEGNELPATLQFAPYFVKEDLNKKLCSLELQRNGCYRLKETDGKLGQIETTGMIFTRKDSPYGSEESTIWQNVESVHFNFGFKWPFYNSLNGGTYLQVRRTFGENKEPLTCFCYKFTKEEVDMVKAELNLSKRAYDEKGIHIVRCVYEGDGKWRIVSYTASDRMMDTFEEMSDKLNILSNNIQMVELLRLCPPVLC